MSRYGRWEVLASEGSCWLCRCDCGKEKVVNKYDLLRGASRSCGCLRRDNLTKHGYSQHPLYPTWKNMVSRCHNPKSISYPNYGARGISVCAKWRESFAAFLADVGPKPAAKYTIDRINNDGNYEPSNVKWSTWSEQHLNGRRSIAARRV